jgi:hypothetical protein
VEQATAAARSLSDGSDNLASQVDRFKVADERADPLHGLGGRDRTLAFDRAA